MKNYSDPRMHTAEHILNQSMVRLFNRGRSFSAHVEKKKSKCDYHFDRDLTAQEIDTLETMVNETIYRNLEVTESFLPREEAEQKFHLGKLPEDAGDTIRIISVGDYDQCPCSGAHVQSTSEIPGFKIISTGYENGVLRIRFRLAE